jgi:hypothetical protein
MGMQSLPTALQFLQRWRGNDHQPEVALSAWRTRRLQRAVAAACAARVAFPASGLDSRVV